MKKQLSVLRHEYSELREQANELLTRADGDLAGSDAERFEEIAQALENIRAEIERGEEAIAALTEQATKPGHTESAPSTPPKRSAHPGKDVAMRSLDAALQRDALTPAGAERVETLLTSGPTQSRSWTERWTATAGDPAYERAYAKVLTDERRGHMRWTPEESEAWRRVAQVQDEQRAMAIGSSSTGGAMVPLSLDPAILLSSDGSNNPLRKLARTVTIATDKWVGVSSEGAEAEWVQEAIEVADGSPDLAQPEIPAHKWDVFVPYSVEAEGDAAQLLNELRRVMVDSVDQLHATVFTTGTGTNQPTGLITALAASTDGLSIVSAAGEAITLADVYKLAESLPPRFAPNAVFAGNLKTWNTLRQFETTNGSIALPGLHEAKPTLFHRAANEVSNMDGAIDVGADADNYVLIFGDFSSFVVVDRVGATMEHVPHLMGANGRPKLQRGALLWGRTGSDVVVDNAFRVLNVATEA